MKEDQWPAPGSSPTNGEDLVQSLMAGGHFFSRSVPGRSTLVQSLSYPMASKRIISGHGPRYPPPRQLGFALRFEPLASASSSKPGESAEKLSTGLHGFTDGMLSKDSAITQEPRSWFAVEPAATRKMCIGPHRVDSPSARTLGGAE